MQDQSRYATRAAATERFRVFGLLVVAGTAGFVAVVAGVGWWLMHS